MIRLDYRHEYINAPAYASIVRDFISCVKHMDEKLSHARLVGLLQSFNGMSDVSNTLTIFSSFSDIHQYYYFQN